MKPYLKPAQYKLYKLIWERFIACQMANCLQSTTQAEIQGGDYIFKASGYTVTFDGFTVLYEESKDEETEKGGALPVLAADTASLPNLAKKAVPIGKAERVARIAKAKELMRAKVASAPIRPMFGPSGVSIGHMRP